MADYTEILEDEFGDDWEWVVDQIVEDTDYRRETLDDCAEWGYYEHVYETRSVDLTAGANVFGAGAIGAILVAKAPHLVVKALAGGVGALTTYIASDNTKYTIGTREKDFYYNDEPGFNCVIANTFDAEPWQTDWFFHSDGHPHRW